MQSNENLKFGDSIVMWDKRIFIQDLVSKLNGIRSSVAEVGVYKGGTAKLILETMDNKDTLFLFDTFEGIPNESEYDNVHIKGDFFDSPYSDIVQYFSVFSNSRVFKGIFPHETGKEIEDQKFKFVHLDVDTYHSYLDSLNFFYDKMISGGYILFDDYNEPSCQGATIAVDLFFKDKEENILNNLKGSYYIIKK